MIKECETCDIYENECETCKYLKKLSNTNYDDIPEHRIGHKEYEPKGMAESWTSQKAMKWNTGDKIK